MLKTFMANYLLPLALMITLSLGGLFLQVYSDGVRIEAVEQDSKGLHEEDDSINGSLVAIVANQEVMLFKLCVLLHDKNLAEC
jgi:hypothetical protein